jgi:uncharacterized membrane protein
MAKKSFAKRLFNSIKSVFLNGLLTLLPVTLTFLLFRATFSLVKGWLSPIQALNPAYLKNIPHVEFALILLFIFLVGLILKLFLLDKLVHALEEGIILRLPLIRPVYTGIKQLAQALTSQDPQSMNKVVILEFPSQGIYSLGFLTGKFPKEISPTQDKDYFSIYVPTTPNPTTGFFVILEEKKFKTTELTRQEAMTIIISGGIIKPDSLSK